LDGSRSHDARFDLGDEHEPGGDSSFTDLRQPREIVEVGGSSRSDRDVRDWLSGLERRPRRGVSTSAQKRAKAPRPSVIGTVVPRPLERDLAELAAEALGVQMHLVLEHDVSLRSLCSLATTVDLVGAGGVTVLCRFGSNAAHGKRPSDEGGTPTRRSPLRV
jgi:hypothetical protein